MAKRHEAVAYLKKGMSPSQIAEKQRVSVGTIEAYLKWGIGEGLISPRNLCGSISPRLRDEIDSLLRRGHNPDQVGFLLRHRPGFDRDDYRIYLEMRSR